MDTDKLTTLLTMVLSGLGLPQTAIDLLTERWAGDVRRLIAMSRDERVDVKTLGRRPSPTEQEIVDYLGKAGFSVGEVADLLIERRLREFDPNPHKNEEDS